MTPPNNAPKTLRRFHANPQSKGSLGKSLETEFRVAWLDYCGVPWAGSDLDDRHGTFFGRHPGRVQLYKLGNEAEAKDTFMELFRGVLRGDAATTAVHVMDTRAQADELFTSALRELKFLELAAEQGLRTTLFLFPTEDTESMANFARIVRFGGDAVDYVIVENPSRSQSKLLRNSKLEASLERVGAKTITLPTITGVTMLGIERAEAKAKRGLTFAELAQPGAEHLERIMAGEIQHALTQMYSQYDAIAELLLPDELAAQVRQRNSTPRRKRSAEDTEADGLGLNFGE